MRINVGCGEFSALGWTNIDVVRRPELRIMPDIVARADDLPEEIQGVESVYCGHFLEHLPVDRIVPTLEHIRDRMVQGAEIVVVGPDVIRATEMYHAGRLDKDTWERCHKSTEPGAWEGSGHFWDCHEELVVKFLTMAGFKGATPIPIRSRTLRRYPMVAPVEWQCAVMAFKE